MILRLACLFINVYKRLIDSSYQIKVFWIYFRFLLAHYDTGLGAHLADTSHTTVDTLVQLVGLYGGLFKEEVDFIIVQAVCVRDRIRSHKLWLCEKKLASE